MDLWPSEEKGLVLSKKSVLKAQATLEGSLLGTSNENLFWPHGTLGIVLIIYNMAGLSIDCHIYLVPTTMHV